MMDLATFTIPVVCIKQMQATLLPAKKKKKKSHANHSGFKWIQIGALDRSGYWEQRWMLEAGGGHWGQEARVRIGDNGEDMELVEGVCE